jgi:hypothetical protein
MVDPWPTLDPLLQATGAPAPVVRWGSRARTSSVQGGTLHFYCDDYRFRALLAPGKAAMVPASGASVAVEPNWSTAPPPRMTRLEAMLLIRRKRLLAVSWQRSGLRILVDLNVDPAWLDLALLGVPPGWRAYATRWQRGMTTQDLRAQAAMARAHMAAGRMAPSADHTGAKAFPDPPTSNLSTQGPRIAPGLASSLLVRDSEQPMGSGSGQGHGPTDGQGPTVPTLPRGYTPEQEWTAGPRGGVPVKNSAGNFSGRGSVQSYGIDPGLVEDGACDFVFVVFGGRRRVREVCRLNGWMWCGEEMDEVRMRGLSVRGL